MKSKISNIPLSKYGGFETIGKFFKNTTSTWQIPTELNSSLDLDTYLFILFHVNIVYAVPFIQYDT